MSIPSPHRHLKAGSAASLALLCVAAVFIFASCTVGPNYHRPAVAVPDAYAGVGKGWKVAQPQAHLPKDRWWEVFGDPELNRLESDAANANQEIKAAAAHFEQARATIDVARSGLFPHIGLSGAATRQRDSFNRPVNGAPAGRSETFNSFTVPLDASYEVDLWGRVRREIESSRDFAEASADDLQSVRLAIQAEVAADYFTLRELESELAILEQSVQAYRKSLELTRNRSAGGLGADLDVSQAETVLKAAEAQIPTTRLERLKAEHALAVLVGQPASTFRLRPQQLKYAPLQIPPGVPSELLERRPDVASAEARMASANANIGIAQAAFYPTVKINGLAGLQSVDAGTVFDWPSRFWAIGPSLSMPVFEGGLLRANLRQTKAAYDETVARYRQTVLNAFAEVEDNLAGEELLARAADAQFNAWQSAKRSLEIATNRYRLGSASYLDVAVAQAASLNLERQTARLRGQQLISVVALAKSLGGGWEKPVPVSPQASQSASKK